MRNLLMQPLVIALAICLPVIGVGFVIYRWRHGRQRAGSGAASAQSARDPFPLRQRVWLVVAPWTLALITAAPSIKDLVKEGPSAFLAIAFFPVGFWFLLPAGFPYFWLFFWLVYVRLTSLTIISKRKPVYFTFYVVLCLLLFTNVIGCRRFKGFP